MKELVVLDLDGVIVKGQSQKLFLDFLLRKKLIAPFFYFKVYLWFVLYKFGFKKNPKNIMTYAYGFLKNKRVEDVHNIVNIFFDTVLKNFVFEEIIDIIKEHQLQKRELMIISNSAEFLVKKIATFLNIKNYIGTRFEITNESYNGKILGDIIYGTKKIEILKDFIKKNNFNLNNTYAYTDHISDLGLLKIVSSPYVVNPDRIFKIEAKQKKWPVLIFK